jgi:hypothetical protein
VQTRNITGQVIGLITFLGGVSLLLLTFRIAYELFQRSPADVLGIKPEQAIDVNNAGKSAMELVFRIVLLLMMCIVGSVIANRGIRLYQASIGEIRLRKETPADDETPAKTDSE